MAASTAVIASPRGSPEGRWPSVSTVKAITTGISAARAASVMPIASSVYVIVMAVMRSAAVAANVRAWKAW